MPLRKDPRVAFLLLILSLAIAPAHGATPEARQFTWHDFGEDGSVRVNLYIFWSETCPHCHRALRFLGALEKELAWLKIQALEVSAPENLARYSALAKQVGTDARYVPAFFYCGRSFQGYDRDETTGRFLKQSLEACHTELLAYKESDGSATTDRAAAAPGAPPIDLPLIGRLQPSSHSLPVLTLVLAGLDAFNPCAFFVLLFLLSLMVHARSRMRMALVGGVAEPFLLVGYLTLVTVGAGFVALFVGAINIKDFVWAKRGISLSIPERAKPGLYQRTRDLVGAANLPAMLTGTVVLALAANAYELLCTAGFPLVFTRILTLADLSAPAYYGYLALYNLIYVLPLLAIVIAFVVTLGTRKLKDEEGRVLKLVSGLMMVGLGIVLLLAPEALNHPPIAIALILSALAVTGLAVLLARWSGRHPRTAG